MKAVLIVEDRDVGYLVLDVQSCLLQGVSECDVYELELMDGLTIEEAIEASDDELVAVMCEEKQVIRFYRGGPAFIPVPIMIFCSDYDIGGFGKAKELLYLMHRSYRIVRRPARPGQWTTVRTDRVR